MQEIDTHINRMKFKFIVLLCSNWLGILESISNFKHDEAGCGHNIEAVDPIPQRDEQFRSLAAVAEEVRGPGHALRLPAHHHHRLPEPGELGEVAVLDGGQGQALVSVAQLGVPVARLLALASASHTASSSLSSARCASWSRLPAPASCTRSEVSSLAPSPRFCFCLTA